MNTTRWILPSEVLAHNTSQDCWVSFLDHVWDLTTLVKDHANDPEYQPIIKAAGTDISHWFNPKTKDIRTIIDPDTELVTPHLAVTELLDVAKIEPDLGVVPPRKPWWKDESRIIGKLSKNPRWIRIVNTLTKLEDMIEVAGEESLWDILARFKKINSHADSYTWKFLGRVLTMEKTLDQNGIKDESAKFARLNLDYDMYIPAIMIYYNDDLTVA
ncbi:Cytochrome b5-like Heme/Steroid binding domain containing protein [Tritrichomonas foetus]|uniref:Cytochrome b5 domain-containing protein 1 n=1 Tax=Tritrichomonas foetus TaxID=1144522 RepID=A0A1J4L0U3_9EUKA|nr:Cytochrome b5-like Heme/Steroid binding domain containing protein [Tritrichomonas foetus]|eukprot:OHT17137.1 Cytochrome b5-like Heme/Steroid binding domain containing protein [Tritrichomonas foetus]